jgi:hypothetical protein
MPSKALMLRFKGVSRYPTVLLALCYSGPVRWRRYAAPLAEGNRMQEQEP